MKHSYKINSNMNIMQKLVLWKDSSVISQLCTNSLCFYKYKYTLTCGLGKASLLTQHMEKPIDMSGIFLSTEAGCAKHFSLDF